MSEYTPITGELRTAMVEFNGEPAMRLDVFNRCCDAIDAIHAQLERENASLKAELDRVLGEQEEHTHTMGESITDELRKWGYGFCGDTHDVVTAIADRIDAEHERQLGVLYRDMSDAEWVRLPKDADGVPIHIGDVMQMDGDSELREVVGFYEEGFLAWRNGRFVPCAASLYRHATPDTWERIEEDARKAMSLYSMPNVVMTLVARCKALCERTKEDA